MVNTIPIGNSTGTIPGFGIGSLHSVVMTPTGHLVPQHGPHIVSVMLPQQRIVSPTIPPIQDENDSTPQPQEVSLANSYFQGGSGLLPRNIMLPALEISSLNITTLSQPNTINHIESNDGENNLEDDDENEEEDSC
eukprot:TRINITY_DN14108_c0_g1_i1.p1 TRINITY_DN14108_c0_g1~~TRINITY_DN14108_c0_g1_i1.p1  ORF type:complete len:136 (-),score=22.24 TRINITY_DN14108_c0_g1_i1:36-443(-)